MNKLAVAIKLDIEQSIIEASQLYEELIVQDDSSLEAFINLACLYWHTTDYGFNASNNMPIEFVHTAGQRMYKVLDEAEKRFGIVTELEFWRYYFNFTTLGEDSFLKEAIAMTKSGSTLVPYFYVYTQTKDARYLPYVIQLLEIAKTQLTTKNRYIISILKS